MPDAKPARKRSLRDTKQELIASYNDLQKQLEERRNIEVKPEERIKERAVKEAVEVADSLSTEEVAKQAGTLKAEVGRVLAQLSDRLESEIAKYKQVQKAVLAKDRELQEIFEIQRNASTLAALIEAQHIKRDDFESEMTAKKVELTHEIGSLRTELEEEQKLHDAEVKERDTAEAKRRERERDDYRYTFAREQNQARDQ